MQPAFYNDRVEAGDALASSVAKLQLKSDAIVLAIPRGGVVVGELVASKLVLELDIIAPRKIGAPSEPELAIGSVMHDGSVFLNEEVLKFVNADPTFIENERTREVEEARRRLNAYRGKRPFPKIAGRDVIIVDDGIATGATMIAALRWSRSQGAERLVAASPVGPEITILRLRREADEVVCPLQPDPFYAIGHFYRSFPQVSDEEVISLLKDKVRTKRD